MLELAWKLDLRAKGGVAHNRIGRVYRAIGHLEEAMRHLGTGHALFDSAGDQRGVASSLDDVGKVHWMRGAYDAAERFMSQSLDIRRELGDPRSIALSLNNLGLLLLETGDPDGARERLRESLELFLELDEPRGAIEALTGLAGTCAASGRHETAARVMAAMDAQREARGFEPRPCEKAVLKRWRREVRSALG